MYVHVQQKKVLLNLNLSNSKTNPKGRSSLTQSKQQQRYRKCTFFHHNEIQLNLLANFLAVCDTMLSSNKKYIALILSVIRVLLTTFISLKCNYTFYPTFMTFCGALTFSFFNTMFQSLPTMMRFNFVHFNSLQTAHACSDYVNLVYFCLSERQKQPEGTHMVNYEAKSDSQCVRNLPEVLELGISAVRKCYVFVLTYICV